MEPLKLGLEEQYTEVEMRYIVNSLEMMRALDRYNLTFASCCNKSSQSVVISAGIKNIVDL